MRIAGNTILITGGGSGIGRGLAEAFHNEGNRVVIAGRRQSALDEVTKANPGMASMQFDIEDPAAITKFAAELVEKFPKLNVVLNNAGIMKPENLLEPLDAATVESTIATNLLGPLRLTTALLPHLRKQSKATVMTVSSGLAFVPLNITPTYCATKAAIHSWSQSLRCQLQNTSVEVIEIVPPYVQTGLMGEQQKTDERAMPLKNFIAEAVSILKTQPDVQEVCVEQVKFLSEAVERGEYAQVFGAMNGAFAAH